MAKDGIHSVMYQYYYDIFNRFDLDTLVLSPSKKKKKHFGTNCRNKKFVKLIMIHLFHICENLHDHKNLIFT